jgi:hypothetical protein
MQGGKKAGKVVRETRNLPGIFSSWLELSVSNAYFKKVT